MMSRRGRRRSSKRRKSSSGSKQSVTPFIFQKQNNSNSVSYKDDAVEKGETDCLGKEHLVGSEDEEKYSDAPPKEKRHRRDNIGSFPNQSRIYSSTREDQEKGLKIVTSVSIDDMEESSPKIIFQQSREPLSENHAPSDTPVTKIMTVDCSSSHMKLEIQEILQHHTSGVKTTVVLMNERRDSTDVRTWTPDNKPPEQPSAHVTHPTSGSRRDQRDAPGDSGLRDGRFCPCCCHRRQISTDLLSADHPSMIPPLNPPSLMMAKAPGKKNPFGKSFSSDQSWDIPPPQEFADIRYNTLEDLSRELVSCSISSCSPTDKQPSAFHPGPNMSCNEESACPCSVEAKEPADRAPSLDQLSEADNYELQFMRPSWSTNRSSFTKDFINCQKRKSWIRNNSIATVEHRACLLPKKRRQTFPGTSRGSGLMQEDLLMPYSGSFSSVTISSLIRCSFPLQPESSGPPNAHNGKQSSLRMSCSEDSPDDVFAVNDQQHHDPGQQDGNTKQSVCKCIENREADDYEGQVDQSEVADSGFDQEIGEVDYHSPGPGTDELSQRALAIKVIPPSCSGSEEHILQSPPPLLLPNYTTEQAGQQDPDSPKQRKSSVKTITVGSLEQRFLLTESRLASSSCTERLLPTASADPHGASWQTTDGHSLSTSRDMEQIQPEEFAATRRCSSPALSQKTQEINDAQADSGRGSTGIHTKELPGRSDKGDQQPASRSSLEAKEHLKISVLKEPDGSASDSWAKRRNLFKESKQWSSAGGSSMTSDITEESVSEDTRSMDMTFGDGEDRGFYTETFHSAAWIYLGDDDISGVIPPSLNTRARAVSIRERTVKISKGTGDYPWGFRIQFSKPIVVTEVDTNGAAEEAGLMVGDYVLAVNGTDVTSIPHSEAAEMARQGPDVLTLTIGSDIARGPNTPRPACRGYLHKRTQSGLIKGWRRRWFVLTHDCCLYYYRHKRDEGKRRALAAVRLEGAEVAPDASLGKPFVLRCRPLTANRMYYFCATSNQEMKRWLEAIETATHPVIQNHVWVDVTRHNSSLPPLAVKNPECLGLLHKMDKSRDTWVQHYCILKDGCLYLYSGIRATHAHGGIYLQGYTVREQPFGSQKSTIELKPPCDEFKTFFFCAENPMENKRWVQAIKASIKKWLPLHQALQDYMSRPPEETRM